MSSVRVDRTLVVNFIESIYDTCSPNLTFTFLLINIPLGCTCRIQEDKKKNTANMDPANQEVEVLQ